MTKYYKMHNLQTNVKYNYQCKKNLIIIRLASTATLIYYYIHCIRIIQEITRTQCISSDNMITTLHYTSA